MRVRRRLRTSREVSRVASGATTRSRTPSWRLRLLAVAVAGLVLAGGMLGLLRLTGGPLELVAGSRSDRTPGAMASTPAADQEAAGRPAAENTAEAGAEAAAEATATTGAAATDTATTTAAAPAGAEDPARPRPVPLPSDAVARDPVSVLQQLADRRAAALLAADPVLLVGAEPDGSSAHEADARTIARLREQRQRYVELAFAVRSAEVVSIAPTTVVLTAVVDRSAYGVVGEDGSTQRVEAGAGVPLRYTLTLGDGGWRLTEVGPP